MRSGLVWAVLAFEGALIALTAFNFARHYDRPEPYEAAGLGSAVSEVGLWGLGILALLEVVLVRGVVKNSPSAGGIMGLRAALYTVLVFLWPRQYLLLVPLLWAELVLYVSIYRSKRGQRIHDKAATFIAPHSSDDAERLRHS